jgi:general secretion pathway protein D
MKAMVITTSASRGLSLGLLALSLAGCGNLATSPPPASSASASPAPEPAMGPVTEVSARLIDTGLRHLGAGEYDKARVHFDALLKLDPRDSTAHFLVAEVYRQKALGGDRIAADLAEVGYRQALSFDAGFWQAADGLGRLYLRDRRYDQAQEMLARAALYQPRGTAPFYRLAVASYYTGDMVTALPAVREAARLQPGEPRILQALALISAAADDRDASQRALQDLDGSLGPRDTARLRERMADWSAYHDRGAIVLAQATSTDAAVQPLPAVKAPDGSKMPRMVQVDVVILRTEEAENAGRGVNLLDSLTMKYSAQRLRTDTATDTVVPGSPSAAGFTRTITRALSVPDIIYSLNIANDSLDKADVVARPTLVASDGQPATFFSGEQVSLALPGNFAGNIEDRNVGVSLAVTPTFIDDRTVLLNVAASRTFLNLGNPSVAGTFSQAMQTTKQAVTTVVAVGFGESLILGGLSERQLEKQRSAVPGLGDVPLIQYLFNRTELLEYTKSVLILLTPRPVETLAGTAGAGGKAAPAAASAGSSLKRLYAQYPQLFDGTKVIDQIRVETMRHNSLLTPARPGDLSAEIGTELHQPRDLERRLRDALYY